MHISLSDWLTLRALATRYAEIAHLDVRCERLGRYAATNGLESLPRVGLIDDSLTITLAAYGFVGERGDQWIGAEPLTVDDAQLLGRPPGTVFLKALRTTYDRQGRFMEQVESWLDPQHFRMHQSFGTPT